MTVKGLIGGIAILSGAILLFAVASHADCTTDTSSCPGGQAITTCYSSCSDGTTGCCLWNGVTGCGYSGPQGGAGVDPSQPGYCQTNTCSACPTSPAPPPTTPPPSSPAVCAPQEVTACNTNCITCPGIAQPQCNQGTQICLATGQWSACNALPGTTAPTCPTVPPPVTPPCTQASASSCTAWQDSGICGGKDTFSNGLIDCSGSQTMLQSSTCSCGQGQAVTVGQCGAPCGAPPPLPPPPPVPACPSSVNASISPSGGPYYSNQSYTVTAVGSSSSGSYGMNISMTGPSDSSTCPNSTGLCVMTYTPTASGTYSYTATASSCSLSNQASANVIVSAAAVLTITPASLTTLPGKGQTTFAVTADGQPIANSLVSWSGSGCGSFSTPGAYAPPANLPTGATSCTATITASYQGGTAQATIKVVSVLISVPASLEVLLGHSVTVTATTSGGPLPSDFAFSPAGGPCTTSSGGSNASMTVYASSYTATCSLSATSPSLNFSQTVTIYVTPQMVGQLTLSPSAASMVPNGSQLFTVTAQDTNHQPMTSVPDIGASVTSPCSVTSSQWDPTGVYSIWVKASTGTATCMLTVGADSVSASAQITVTNSLLEITSPSDGGTYVLRSSSDIIAVSGVVAGAQGVGVSGANCTVQMGTTDPVTQLTSWVCDWTQASGLAPGTKTVGASAGSLTAPSISFDVYGPPNPPAISASPPKVYEGATVILSGTATDNSANPAKESGIENVFLKADLGSDGFPMNFENGIWSYTLTNVTRASNLFQAEALNNAGAYSQPGPVAISVLTKPTITIVLPITNSTYPSGTVVNVQAFVNDPDKLTTRVTFNVWGSTVTTFLPNPSGQYSFPLTVTAPNDDPYTNLTATVYFPDLNGGAELSSVSPIVTLIVESPPSLSVPASASPNPVNGGLMTLLTAGATSSFGASGLSYQWTVSTGAPGPVSLDFGGANPTVRATFTNTGSYAFTATITDPLGESVQTSTTVVVNVGTPTSSAPTVQIVSMTPSNPNFIAPLTMTLTASVSGISGVNQIMYYANGNPIGSASASPYKTVWSNMLPGNYYLQAAATDNQNNTVYSSPSPITVNDPVVVITTVTPSGATTQDNSQGNPSFSFNVEGAGFVRGNSVVPGSVVLWNGAPVITVMTTGNVLDGVLNVILNNGELLNPQTASLQVRNPNSILSAVFPFVVDGEPIVKCITTNGQTTCQNAAQGNSQAAAHALVGGGVADIPVSRNDYISVVSQYTGGGIRLSLSSGNNVYASNFMQGTSFQLSQLPAAPSGNYTLTAQGMNLAGAVSAPASVNIFLVATDLSSVRVFPDPWRSDQDAGLPITFDHLSDDSTVKLFTVSGHWVATLPVANNSVAWNLKNNDGEMVQSGLYLYLITDGQGNKVHGKLAIIR